MGQNNNNNMMMAGMKTAEQIKAEQQSQQLKIEETNADVGIKAIIKGKKKTDKIKVIVTATDRFERGEQFVSVGMLGAAFHLNVPIKLPVGIIEFLIDKESCANVRHYTDKDGNHTHEMVQKYIVTPA